MDQAAGSDGALPGSPGAADRVFLPGRDGRTQCEVLVRDQFPVILLNLLCCLVPD